MLANTNPYGEVNPGIHPICCEQCGEVGADVTLKYANLCNACAIGTLRNEFSNVFPYHICGQPVFNNGKLIAVCVVKYGVEHCHTLLFGRGPKWV